MKKARNALILSMIIFGTIGLFVRLLPVSSQEIALYRAILASFLIGFYLKITRTSIPYKEIRKELPFLLFSGMAMGFNWIFLFEAYKYTTISIATLSYYFAPVLVMIICPLLFREKITLKDWFCFLISTLGIILITGLGQPQASNHLLGIFYGLSAAILYATVILINKFIKNVDGIQRTFLQFIAAIIVLLPYVLLTSGIQIAHCSLNALLILLIVGFVHTGITYCLYFTSLKDLPGQKVALLSYIDPLVAIIISVLFLHEPLSFTQAIGGILILGATIYNEIKKS